MRKKWMKQCTAALLLVAMLLSSIPVQAYKSESEEEFALETVLINDSCNSLKTAGWTSESSLVPRPGSYIIDSGYSWGKGTATELPETSPVEMGRYLLFGAGSSTVNTTGNHRTMTQTVAIGAGEWMLTVDMDIESLITPTAYLSQRGVTFAVYADGKLFRVGFNGSDKISVETAANGAVTSYTLAGGFPKGSHTWGFAFNGTNTLTITLDGEVVNAFVNGFYSPANPVSDRVIISNAPLNRKADSADTKVYINHIRLTKQVKVPTLPTPEQAFSDDCTSFTAGGWEVSSPLEGVWATDSGKTMGDTNDYVETAANAGEYSLYADSRAGDNFGRTTMNNPMAVMHKDVEIGPYAWEFRFNAKIENLIKPANFVAFRGLQFDIIAGGKYYKLTFHDQNKILGIISTGFAYQMKAVEMPGDGQFHWWSIGCDGIGTVYITLDGVRIASFENMGIPAASALLPAGISKEGDSITIVNNSTDWRRGENRVTFTDMELWRMPTGDRFTVIKDIDGMQVNSDAQWLSSEPLGTQPWFVELNMNLSSLVAATSQDAGLRAAVAADGRLYTLDFAPDSLQLAGKPVGLTLPTDGKIHQWGLVRDSAGALLLALDGTKAALVMTDGDETELGDGLYLTVTGQGTWALLEKVFMGRSATPEWAQYHPAFLSCSVYPADGSATAVISMVDINHSWLGSNHVQLRGTVYDEDGVQLAQTTLQPTTTVLNMTLNGLNEAGRRWLVVELVSGGIAVTSIERWFEIHEQSLVLQPGGTAAAEQGCVYTFNQMQKMLSENGESAVNSGWTPAALSYEGMNTSGVVLENGEQAQTLSLPASLNGWFRVHVGYATGTQSFVVSNGQTSKNIVIDEPAAGEESLVNEYGEKVAGEAFAFAAQFNGGTITIEPVENRRARIAYIKLIAMTQDEIDLWNTPLESSVPGGGKRVTYSNDGYSDFYQNLYNTKEGFVAKTIDTYIDSDVGSFDWMTGSTLLTNYKSDVAGMPFEGIPESSLSVMRAGDIKAMENILKIINDNPDTNTLKILGARGDELGIKVNAAIRMASYYDKSLYPSLAGWMLSNQFSTEPTDYRQTSAAGAKTITMSYYYKGFRDFMKALIVEAASFDGVDGVTLDYCRYPYLMSGYEPELIADYKAKYGAGAYDDVLQKPADAGQFQQFQTTVITDFMREVHDAVKQQNPDTTILVRVPKVIGEQKGFFNIPLWLDEGLVDVVISSTLGQEDLTDSKIVLNMVLEHNESAENPIAVWGGIEAIMSGTDATKDEHELAKRGIKFTKTGSRVSREQYLLRAKEMYDDGYEGIYIYNNWPGKDSLGLIGDKVKVNKWHAFEYPASWVQSFVTVFDPAVNPPDLGPEITGVVIEGDQINGALLTAEVTFKKGGKDAVDSDFRYQWNRDEAAIAGATGKSYTSVVADIGKALTVSVTAIDVIGTEGNTVTSDPVAIGINPSIKPIISNISVLAVADVASTSADGITLNYSYSDANGLPEGATRIEYYLDGVLLSSQYVGPEDIGKTLRVEIIPVNAEGIEGEKVTAETIIIEPENALPVVRNINMNSAGEELQIGKTITATYEYIDYTSVSEGDTSLEWYLADDSSGANEVFAGNGHSITLTKEMRSKLLILKITPRNVDGKVGNTVSSVSQAEVAHNPLFKPAAVINSIHAEAGRAAVVNYTFNDDNGFNEMGSVREWLLEGVSKGASFTPSIEDIGKKIEATLTPGNEIGMKGDIVTGEAIILEGSYVPDNPDPEPEPKPTPAPVYETKVEEGQVITTIPAKTATDANGRAVAAISESHLVDAIAKAAAEAAKLGDKTDTVIRIEVSATADTNSTGINLTAEALRKFVESKADTLVIVTSFGTMTFDKKAVKGIAAQATGIVTITATKVEASELTAEIREKIGDRPVISCDIADKNKAISHLGGTATVTIPYVLKAGENPNAIVAYYIDSAGKLLTVAKSKYDPASGTLTFKTPHFSKYVVGYNKVDFADVAEKVWYHDAVTFAAARGITAGVGGGSFGSNETVTRAQVLVMLMKAFGISPDSNVEDNFSDAGNTYYTGYLAAAKRLGITAGVGGNLFAPNRQITRQEMFVLTYNTLKSIDELPAGAAVKDLQDFKDAGEVSSYAKEAIELFVKTGVMSRSNGNLLPDGNASRAQFVQIIYNIMKR